jgi:hypothetical protein
MKTIIFFLISFLNFIQAYSQTPQYYPGFPKIIDSTKFPGSNKAGVPLIIDIEKDGQKEIVFISGNLEFPKSKLYVIKSDGSIYPSFPVGFNSAKITATASGDIDNNGYLDIVVRSVDSIFVIDRLGKNIPGFPIRYSDGLDYSERWVSLYDLDNDAKLEIISNIVGGLCVFKFNGQIMAGWPKTYVGKSQANPAIGDIDNDGYPEIILGTYRQFTGDADSSALRIYRFNGNNFSNNWPIYDDSSYLNWSASPSIILNNNFIDSTFIFVITGGDNDSVTHEKINRITKYNIFGNIIDRGYAITYNGLGTLSIGDINNDGLPEFSTGSFGRFEHMHLFDYNMKVIPGWPVLGDAGEWNTAVIGKLTYGNNLNVLAGFWGTNSGKGSIFAYNENGLNLSWSPLEPWGLERSLSMSDINNDGSVEIIALFNDYLPQQNTVLNIWTLSGIPYTNENFPWPQFGHDRYRTNQYKFVPPDEPIGIKPISNNVPGQFVLYQNYPNPFNPSTKIKFDIPKQSEVKIIVFDILGREVTTLVNEQLKPGTYNVVFDGSNYSSGVYYYTLNINFFNQTKRMVLIK